MKMGKAYNYNKIMFIKNNHHNKLYYILFIKFRRCTTLNMKDIMKSYLYMKDIMKSYLNMKDIMKSYLNMKDIMKSYLNVKDIMKSYLMAYQICYIINITSYLFYDKYNILSVV